MNPSTINPDEMLKSMTAQAVKQHEQIRTSIRDITLKALQMRDLTLEQINGVVRNITAGVNIGVGIRLGGGYRNDSRDTRRLGFDRHVGRQKFLLVPARWIEDGVIVDVGPGLDGAPGAAIRA